MSVWLTPDLKPFVGGTYFPPQDRWGQPGFKKVLERIAAAWKQDHEKIAEQGTKIIAALSQAAGAGIADPGPNLGPKTLETAYQQIARSYDAHEGGFGVAPKFPRPVTLNFLSRVYARNPDSDSGKHALEMSRFTLRKMAAGGMHDHLGGGFHRYSVDANWHVPHFEKMLYDQAQLVVAYLEAFQISREPLFEEVARDTLDYVRRDMTAKDGGFFSAEDADSEIPVAAVYDRRNSSRPRALFNGNLRRDNRQVVGVVDEPRRFWPSSSSNSIWICWISKSRLYWRRSRWSIFSCRCLISSSALRLIL